MARTDGSVVPGGAGRHGKARLPAALATAAAAVLVAVSATGVFAVAHPADAAFPGGNGLIAFVSNRDVGASEIYTMRTDGIGTTRITFPTGGNSDPAFSPDGVKIAFKSSGNDIHVTGTGGMNADGSGSRRLTNTPVVPTL